MTKSTAIEKIKVPKALEAPMEKALEFVSSAVKKNPQLHLSVLNVTSHVVSNLQGKNRVEYAPQQIKNKDAVFKKIASYGMLGVDPSRIYCVSRENGSHPYVAADGTRKSMTMYDLAVTLNYLEEENVMTKYSSTFQKVIDVTPIFKEMKWNEDFAVVKTKVQEFVVATNKIAEYEVDGCEILKPGDPTREWTLDDITSLIVRVLRKDGQIDSFLIKRKVIVGAILAKFTYIRGTKEKLEKLKNDNMYGKDSPFNEDMIEKIARRRVYKYYPLDQDLVMAKAFRETIHDEYDFSNTAQDAEIIEKDPEVISMNETRVIKPEPTPIVEKVVETKVDTDPELTNEIQEFINKEIETTENEAVNSDVETEDDLPF